MAKKAKKFDACVLRIDQNKLIIAGYDQLVTVADKSKLVIGSSVGFKGTNNKREKPVRGSIVVIGE